MKSTGITQTPGWQIATVLELIEETPRTRSIVLKLADRCIHRPGQHVDVRLTAPDGYQAHRCYSIASAPDDDLVMLTVQRLADGQVSGYLVDGIRRGDALDIRAPVGGYFAWDDAVEGPLLLIADGLGIVPVRSMLRHHGTRRSTTPVRLIYSAPSRDELIYRDELLGIAARDEMDISFTLTRNRSAGWHGYYGRVDRALIAELGWPPDDRPIVYVSGPTGFVEATASALLALGHEPGRIRTERFGRAD